MNKRKTLKKDIWKTTLAVSLLVLLFIVHAIGSPGAGGEAKKLLHKSVTALGGVEAVRGWKTRTATGTTVMYNPGWGTLTATASQFIKKPNKCKIDNDFSAYDHPFYYTYYYNCGQAWAVINLTVRQSPGITDNLEGFMKTVDGVAYYFEECDTFYLVDDAPGDSLLEASEFHRVGCVHEGDTVLFDLSRKDFTPLRMIENGGSEHSLFTDYREVDGARVPFYITTYRNGALHGYYEWEKIEFGTPIDDAIFEEDRPAIEEGAR